MVCWFVKFVRIFTKIRNRLTLKSVLREPDSVILFGPIQNRVMVYSSRAGLWWHIKSKLYTWLDRKSPSKPINAKRVEAPLTVP